MIITKEQQLKIKKSTDARPECNFCFSKDIIITINIVLEGNNTGSFLKVSICKACLKELKKIES